MIVSHHSLISIGLFYHNRRNADEQSTLAVLSFKQCTYRNYGFFVVADVSYKSCGGQCNGVLGTEFPIVCNPAAFFCVFFNRVNTGCSVLYNSDKLYVTISFVYKAKKSPGEKSFSWTLYEFSFFI